VKSVLYGGELLADEASCYGAQQKDRNLGKRKEYARRHGNGTRITDFSAITVAEPRESDRRYVPSGAKLPVAPESGEVLPVKVTSEEVDQAIALLAELPAEPTADRSGAGGDVLLDLARVRQARQTASQRTRDEETTVLFVSDTHLGYENRAETGSGKTVSWIDEISSRETIHRIRTIAIEQDVDAVLHTGDVLDHEVDAVTLDAAASSLDVLSQLGVPVYCIIGTHDHNTANPQHSGSVDGVAWLKEQVSDGNLIELDTTPTAVASGSLDAYGVSAENVGIDDVGTYNSLGWQSSEIAFGAASPGPNVLCLHEGVTPYRSQSVADVDLDELLSESRVSFDCVLVGDEHRPKNDDFENGYAFETQDGTPVLYTGPAARVGPAYSDREAFVTVFTIGDSEVSATRHAV
jgi:predicted MPP superfamily phosphohydrolase